MKTLLSTLVVALFFIASHSNAAGLAESKRDCAEIMSKYAQDADSVPAHLVAGCQEMMAADRVAVAEEPAPIQDPCADDAAAASVRCWGPWSALAPAAGGAVNPAITDIGDFDTRPELADRLTAALDPVDPVVPVVTDPMMPVDPAPVDPMPPVAGPDPMMPVDPVDPMPVDPIDPVMPVDPVPPVVVVDPVDPVIPPVVDPGPNVPTPPQTAGLNLCETGADCGFSVLDPAFCSHPEDQTVGTFTINRDGDRFAFDQGGPDEIRSVDNGHHKTTFEGQTAYRGEHNGYESGFAGEMQTNANGKLVQASGIWGHGATGFIDNHLTANLTEANGGRYVWGNTSNQHTLDSLNNGGQGISLHFLGNNMISTDTAASVTVNFGTQPNWTGEWENSATSVGFSAGGDVQGVNLVSDSSQFSANIVADQSFIQGLLLGELGAQSLATALELVLQDGTIIKDVGLLQQQ